MKEIKGRLRHGAQSLGIQQLALVRLSGILGHVCLCARAFGFVKAILVACSEKGLIVSLLFCC